MTGKPDNSTPAPGPGPETARKGRIADHMPRTLIKWVSVASAERFVHRSLKVARRFIGLMLAARIVVFDAIAGLFLTVLIMDAPRRMPVLYVAIPALCVVNFLIVRWKKRNPASFTLPVAYAVGLLGGIIWMVAAFAWWKIPLPLVPSALLFVHIQRFRRANRAVSA